LRKPLENQYEKVYKEPQDGIPPMKGGVPKKPNPIRYDRGEITKRYIRGNYRHLL